MVKSLWRLDQYVLRYVVQYAKFCLVFAQLFKKYALLNSEVTGPMFTKFLHNVEAV